MHMKSSDIKKPQLKDHITLNMITNMIEQTSQTGQEANLETSHAQVTELQDKVKDMEVRLQASNEQKKELQDKVKDLEAKMVKDREKANRKHDALQTRLEGMRQTWGTAATSEEVATLRDQVQGLLRRR